MVMSPPISTPSCYSISKPSYVQLQQDVLYTSGSTCYYIFNSNSSSGKQTTINCNGHTVYAPNGGTFADINGAESTIIENCYLIGFSKGVVSNARNTKIINSTIANAQYSVILNGTSYSNVENDTFNNDTYGVYSQSSSYGVISNNNFINPGYGIYLLGGTAFRIIENHIGSSADTAISLLNSQLDQLQNNLANGNALE
jgi:parallel beta-helix repeat (two copies)